MQTTEINKRISKNVTLVQPEFDPKGQLQSPHCVNNITTETPISTLVTLTVKIQSVEEKQPTVYTAKMSVHTTYPPLWPTPYAVMKKEPNLSVSVQSSVFYMTC